MLTKKNIWFLTLFSIILVMAVYYISYPTNSDTLVVSNKDSSYEGLEVTVEESSTITALKVGRDETLEKEAKSIKEILVDETKTVEEKNDAYEALKQLNTNKGKEETIEKMIKDKLNYNSFVTIDGSNVKVIIDSNEHNYEFANKIITEVQKEFDNKMFISVSFQSQ